MPMRGVSQGYTAKDTGCLIKMRGVLPETAAHARKAAEALCARVKAACPAARCLIHWMPPKAEEGSELHIGPDVDKTYLNAIDCRMLAAAFSRIADALDGSDS
jgi:hypothetical protein